MTFGQYLLMALIICVIAPAVIFAVFFVLAVILALLGLPFAVL